MCFIEYSHSSYEDLVNYIQDNGGIKIFGTDDILNNKNITVLFPDNSLCFGLTYYHVGLVPQILFEYNKVFLGFDKNISIIDYKSKKILVEISAFSLFYEFIVVSERDVIIVVCELEIFAFDKDVNILWKKGLKDIIVDFKIIGNYILEIKCYDGEIFIFEV